MKQSFPGRAIRQVMGASQDIGIEDDSHSRSRYAGRTA